MTKVPWEFAPGIGAPVRGLMFVLAGRGFQRGGCALQSDFQYFTGIDWGSEKHRVCLMDRQAES